MSQDRAKVPKDGAVITLLLLLGNNNSTKDPTFSEDLNLKPLPRRLVLLKMQLRPNS
jgi:hypothetical protein